MMSTIIDKQTQLDVRRDHYASIQAHKRARAHARNIGYFQPYNYYTMLS